MNKKSITNFESKEKDWSKLKINTGNSAFDEVVNDLIATKGRDYAIQYIKSQQPTAQAITMPVKSSNIKTGNPNLDKTVNDILAKQGKQAAINYLKNLQKSVVSLSEPAKQPVIKLGDEIIKPSDPRYAQIMKSYKGDLSEAIAQVDRITLTEAKARIDHPEDLVIDEGAAGAMRALNAMLSLAATPKDVTVKFDGSPALIFGWDSEGFVLTDKSGFSAKGYDGMTRSPDAVAAMLRGDTGRRIKDTSPEALKQRNQYADKIAGIYQYLKALVPSNFKGYLQGDLMWSQTPPLENNHYVFKPVKVTYRIPADSNLGEKIAKSQYGIVIHSVFASREDEEPESIRDIGTLHLNQVPEVVVVPHEMNIPDTLSLPTAAANKLKSFITSSSGAVNTLFDGSIKSLQPLMKSYLAWKAGKGSDDYSNSAEEFIQWLDSEASKTTDSMRGKVKEHITKNAAGYSSIWSIIDALVKLKLYLKTQLDKLAAGSVAADLHGAAGHEGFVADTEHGKIKLVNRAKFMAKDQPVAESASGGGTSAGSIASVANPIGGVISRTPNLFGYVPYAAPKKTKKKKRKAST